MQVSPSLRDRQAQRAQREAGCRSGVGQRMFWARCCGRGWVCCGQQSCRDTALGCGAREMEGRAGCHAACLCKHLQVQGRLPSPTPNPGPSSAQLVRNVAPLQLILHSLPRICDEHVARREHPLQRRHANGPLHSAAAPGQCVSGLQPRGHIGTAREVCGAQAQTQATPARLQRRPRHPTAPPPPCRTCALDALTSAFATAAAAGSPSCSSWKECSACSIQERETAETSGPLLRSNSCGWAGRSTAWR